MTAERFFAVSAPGLEPITAQELKQLRIDFQITTGGVEFRGALPELYRANLYLRTASRVLVRVGEFYAAAFSELRKKAGRLAWEAFLHPGQPIAIKATAHKSRLFHSDAVAERVAGAIGDRLGKAAAHEKGREAAEVPAAQLVVVRLVRDLCTISVDSSGALLHLRGYRQATAKAPLRETLAAGMLLASGWNGTAPLMDPFCGAGTIVIEAALLALKLAPGRARRFAFMAWPDFDAGLWQALQAEADEAARSAAARPALLGSDRDAGAVAAAQANAERAGVAAQVDFSRRPFSAIEPPPGAGWVVTNPPYGVRLRESNELRNLYSRFGRVLQERCPGWQVAMLSADRRLMHCTGLPFDEARSLALVNGGLHVTLVQGRVPPRRDTAHGAA